jgi:hypothetical protein
MIVRALVVVVEVLFWLLVVRLLGRALAAAFAPGRRADARAAPGPRRQVKAVEDLVLDRVCRTHIPLSSALTARVGGSEQHFCSAACRDKALAAVARAS